MEYSIVREINQVLKFYGIYVDRRNPELLAALICNQEKVMGMTRHGLNRGDNGVLMKATFEETSEVLHRGARFAQKDTLKGVSEAIIIGSVPPIGTGKMDVFLDESKLFGAKDYLAFKLESQTKVVEKNTKNMPYQADLTSLIRGMRPNYNNLDDLDSFLYQSKFSGTYDHNKHLLDYDDNLARG